MDPISIAASCASLVSTIGTVSLSIDRFVQTCRDARKDLDKVSRELRSLKLVLSLIKDDATEQLVSSIVSDCESVILEIETCIARYRRKRLKAQVTWAMGGQGDVEKLRTRLETHKSTLELELGRHGVEITKDIKANTTIMMDKIDKMEQTLQEFVRAQQSKDVPTTSENVPQKLLQEMAPNTTIVGSLATSNEPQPPNQQPAALRNVVRLVPRRASRSLRQARRVAVPAIIPSEDEATSAQRTVPAVMEVSASKDSDTGAGVYTARRLGPTTVKAPMPKGSDADLATPNEPQLMTLLEDEGVPESSAVTTRPLNLATVQKSQAQARRPPARPRPLVRKARGAAYPARIPFNVEATSAQRTVPAVMEASASKDSDTGAGVYTARRLGPTTVKAPMPKGSDAGLATSDEPQFPSLAPLDGVLPKAPIVQTRPGDGLGAPGKIQPQRPSNPAGSRMVRRRVVSRKIIPVESSSPVPPQSSPNFEEILPRQSDA